MATHSSILAFSNPWTEEPGGLYRPRGHRELDTMEVTFNACTHILMCTNFISQLDL